MHKIYISHWTKHSMVLFYYKDIFCGAFDIQIVQLVMFDMIDKNCTVTLLWTLFFVGITLFIWLVFILCRVDFKERCSHLMLRRKKDFYFVRHNVYVHQKAEKWWLVVMDHFPCVRINLLLLVTFSLRVIVVETTHLKSRECFPITFICFYK